MELLPTFKTKTSGPPVRNWLAKICCDELFPDSNITTNHSVAPKTRLVKFAAVGSFLTELDIFTNKPITANFAPESVGEICCYWLFLGLNNH